jgi:hypothetical protein
MWEEDEDDEDGEERGPQQNIEPAEAVLERLSNEEWLANVFGSEVTDVLFGALDLYIEHQKQTLPLEKTRVVTRFSQS